MILVTGATGFLGSHFLIRLTATNEDIRCFVRKTSDTRGIDFNRVEVAYGSFEEPSSYQAALEGVDILVNIASLGFGHASTMVNAAEKANSW